VQKFMQYFSLCRRCQIRQTCFTRWGSYWSTDGYRQYTRMDEKM